MRNLQKASKPINKSSDDLTDSANIVLDYTKLGGTFSDNFADISDVNFASNLNSKSLFEEVDDYNFINIVDDEVHPVNDVTELSDDMKAIIALSGKKDSPLMSNYLGDHSLESMINNLIGQSGYRVLFHDNQSASYLEIIDQVDGINLRLDSDSITNIDNHSLDVILAKLNDQGKC